MLFDAFKQHNLLDLFCGPNVLLVDSLKVISLEMKKKNSPIKCCQSKPLSAIDEFLMKEKFRAHEDVTALVKILFGSSLCISQDELIASSICSRDFVLSMPTGEEAKARKSTLQEVPLSDGKKEKLAKAGLDNSTLTRIFQQRVYSKFWLCLRNMTRSVVKTPSQE